MSTLLTIEQITDQGTLLLARIADDTMLIGREPVPSGIQIPSFAISGTHGQFIRQGIYWLYRDLASTNGSWFNEKQLPAGHLHLIKNGDHLLLANTILKLSLEFVQEADEPAVSEGPSLLVFWDDTYLGDVLLESGGAPAIFGGPDSLFNLPENFSKEMQIRIQVLSSGAACERLQGQIPLFLNMGSAGEQLVLHDRDQLKCDRLQIIYNEGFKSPVYSESIGGDLVSSTGTFVLQQGQTEKQESSQKEARLSSAFGVMPQNQRDDDDLSHIPLHTQSIIKSGAVTRRRSTPEDIIVYLVAGGLLLVVFLFFVWFVLSQAL